MQIGTIIIEELMLPCLIGVYDYERQVKQDVMLHIEIEFDVTQALISDCVKETIDYDKIIDVCEQVCNKRHYALLETLIDACLGELFKYFPLLWGKIRGKKVDVKKAKGIFIELQKGDKCKQNG